MNNSKKESEEEKLTEHLELEKIKKAIDDDPDYNQKLEEKRIAEEEKLTERLREEHKDIPFLFSEENKLTSEKEINDSVGPSQKCPFCAEEILKEAIKCKHCGEFIKKKEKVKYTWDKKENQLQQDNSNSHSKRIEITNNYKGYLFVLVIVVFAAGYWISKGTPNPTLFFAANDAKRECLSLANKNKGSFFLLNNADIETNKTWIKNGKRVVQLIQGKGNSLNRVMCIYGNGMVEIPGMLEQGKWR